MEQLKSWDDTHIDYFLEITVNAGYDTLHLDSGKPPRMQRRGDDTVVVLPGFQSGSSFNAMSMVYGILTDEQIRAFEKDHALMFRYAVKNIGSFAAIAVRHNGSVATSFHLVPA